MSFDPPPLPPQYGPLQVWWEAVRQGLKAELGALEEAQAALAAAVAAQADATAAATAAASAATAAASANSAAATVTLNDAISVSYTAPGTVLSAADAGTDVTITIAAHSRVYGDHTVVSVTGGSITGMAYSTDYYVYYDQTSRAGGSVTYHADTNANHALPNAASGRHFVGKVSAPASGGVPTSGGSAPPSGGGGVDKGDVHSTL